MCDHTVPHRILLGHFWMNIASVFSSLMPGFGTIRGNNFDSIASAMYAYIQAVVLDIVFDIHASGTRNRPCVECFHRSMCSADVHYRVHWHWLVGAFSPEDTNSKSATSSAPRVKLLGVIVPPCLVGWAFTPHLADDNLCGVEPGQQPATRLRGGHLLKGLQKRVLLSPIWREVAPMAYSTFHSLLNPAKPGYLRTNPRTSALSVGHIGLLHSSLSIHQTASASGRLV